MVKKSEPSASKKGSPRQRIIMSTVRQHQTYFIGVRRTDLIYRYI